MQRNFVFSRSQEWFRHPNENIEFRLVFQYQPEMSLKFKGSLGFVVLELVGGSSEYIRYINGIIHN